MAGFFGLFGSGEQSRFLDSDDAKTLGDVDYMRMAKTVRRTFPKTANNKQVGEKITQTSAVEQRDMSGNSMPSSSFNSTNGASAFQPKTQSSNANSERRSTDTSMDMFRNMARDIKKR